MSDDGGRTPLDPELEAKADAQALRVVLKTLLYQLSKTAQGKSMIDETRESCLQSAYNVADDFEQTTDSAKYASRVIQTINELFNKG